MPSSYNFFVCGIHIVDKDLTCVCVWLVGLSYSSSLRTSPLMRLFLTKRLIVQIRLFCLFPPFSPLFVFSTLPSLSLPVLSIANTVTRSTHQYYWSIADIFHWYILSIQYQIKFLIRHWGWSRFFYLKFFFLETETTFCGSPPPNYLENHIFDA